jgi:1,4-alpha-glucan branching enzyme
MTTNTTNTTHGVSRLTDHDIYLFKEGSHFRLYEKLGSHVMTVEGVQGTYFGVWAPNAEKVSVIGDFNGWNPESNPLSVRWDESGIWEGFIPDIGHGTVYKYHIVSNKGGYQVAKADPFAFRAEMPPKTASIVWDLNHEWKDKAWMKKRGARNALDAPISIYEVHLGSWRRIPEEGNRFLTYREIAPYLADYVKEMGFTHVELMPVMEHPFYGSWGYQVLGYFAPTSRYGSPEDLMYLIEYLHKKNIGVILDWVPSHFPNDEHGLVYFDGSHLFEHADPKRGFHPEWKSQIFNEGRYEVRAFLISSALFWLDKYHADGMRIDGVASMLYLDYSRKEGEWTPNRFGGRENLDAVDFLRQLNEAVYRDFPDVQTIAEESTSWPMVTRPVYTGGLGFGMKWNMGWMHDTLEYFSKDPVHRKFHHNQITFSIWYGFSENFVLPLSHDEVVHGKCSLAGRMPGDDWQKAANLRLMFGYMYTHPGKKLLFMGDELGQWEEWNHRESLNWELLEHDNHAGIKKWTRDLNKMYKREKALYELDVEQHGFEWIDLNDSSNSTISFIRKGKSTDDMILVVCNFTPVERSGYRVGVPRGGFWKEILNSNARRYGGSGSGNYGGLEAEQYSCHGRDHSLSLTLPGLAAIILKSSPDEK